MSRKLHQHQMSKVDQNSIRDNQIDHSFNSNKFTKEKLLEMTHDQFWRMPSKERTSAKYYAKKFKVQLGFLRL